MGTPTVYFDTVMADRLFFERMLANVSNVNLKTLKSGTYTKEEFDRIQQAKQWIKEQPFVHIYDPQFTNDKIYATCNILMYKMGLQFVCFDYIKGNDTDAFALSNKLGQVTDVLKNEIAGDLGMCVLAACQLNKQNEISSSDKIAMYASTIVMWRYKTSSEIKEDGGLDYGNIYTRIYLNRNGAMQDDDEWMNLKFDGDTQTIVDCKQNERPDQPF
jgi:replicative DNA helicase